MTKRESSCRKQLLLLRQNHMYFWVEQKVQCSFAPFALSKSYKTLCEVQQAFQKGFYETAFPICFHETDRNFCINMHFSTEHANNKWHLYSSRSNASCKALCDCAGETPSRRVCFTCAVKAMHDRRSTSRCPGCEGPIDDGAWKYQIWGSFQQNLRKWWTMWRRRLRRWRFQGLVSSTSRRVLE